MYFLPKPENFMCISFYYCWLCSSYMHIKNMEQTITCGNISRILPFSVFLLFEFTIIIVNALRATKRRREYPYNWWNQVCMRHICAQTTSVCNIRTVYCLYFLLEDGNIHTARTQFNRNSNDFHLKTCVCIDPPSTGLFVESAINSVYSNVSRSYLNDLQNPGPCIGLKSIRAKIKPYNTFIYYFLFHLSFHSFIYSVRLYSVNVNIKYMRSSHLHVNNWSSNYVCVFG